MATKSTYVHAQTNVGVFENPAHRECIRQLTQRISDLESVNSQQGFGPKGRVAPLPDRPQLSVTSNAAMPGQFFVRITNPQFIQAAKPKNPIGAPIVHRLEASQDPNFASGITDFPISAQNYFTVSELGSGTWHFRVRSSYDGKSFSLPVVHAPVTA